jgi:hypothetical protein
MDDAENLLAMATLMVAAGLTQWGAAKRMAEVVEGEDSVRRHSTATKLDGKFRKNAPRYRYHGRLAVLAQILNREDLPPYRILKAPQVRQFLADLHGRGDLSDADKDRVQADLWDHLRGRPAREFLLLPDSPTNGDPSRYEPALLDTDATVATLDHILAVLEDLTGRNIIYP